MVIINAIFIFNSMQIVDLTRRISSSMQVFPGSPPPSFIPWAKFEIHGYASELIFMNTHTGTHIDAPSHFAPNMTKIDKIPVDRFVSSAVLVKATKQPNYLIEQEDIKGIQLNRGDAVVLKTGWEKCFGKKNYMTENPGLSDDAAKYLVRKKVSLVAIDGPSIDAGFDTEFTAHHILLPAGILAVENICNLDRIAKDRFMLIASPLKLAGATGSPVRALAIT
jgi:arylformamidase